MDESKKIPKNFCVMPFIAGIVKTNGTIGVCCNIRNDNLENIYNIKKNTIKEWKDSTFRKNLQKEFLLGNKPEVCKKCWHHEKIGRDSLRIAKNKHYKLNYFKTVNDFLKKFPLKKDPIEWELQVTNLCNLKCQMCSGRDSSKLLVENKKIYKSIDIELTDEEKQDLKADQKDFDVTNEQIEKLKEVFHHNLKEINLRGGEPLIIPKIEHLLNFIIEKDLAKKLILHITTNVTVVNKNILKMLGKFKKIRLMLSIESTNKQNDYIRFPSEWKNIENNIEAYKNLNNIEFYVLTTVSNLNLFYIDQLIDFSIKNNFFTKLEFVESPNYMHFSIMPKELLEKSLKKLIQIKEKIKDLSKVENLETLISLIQKEIVIDSLDAYKWNKFIKIIKLRDSYRKIHIRDYMPELTNYIYN